LHAERAYVLGTESLVAEVESGGIRMDAKSPQAVLLGMDVTLTYDKLARATHLIRGGIPFVATHPDLLCPSPEGPVPDCGSLAAALAASAGVEPTIVGKPYPAMLKTALRRLDARPEETAIVGDRLYTDMEMGFRGGLMTILVLTGEATRELAREYHRHPDLVVPSVRDLAALMA
jgi:HAD superfamily hydrolase (TIGR01450 family)